MKKIAAYSGILFFVCSLAVADEIKTFSASGRAMVAGEAAGLFIGEEPKGELPPGTIVRVTSKEGSWLFVPQSDAWVKEETVIPIEKSEAHFTNIIKQEPTAVAYHHRGIAREALGYHELAMKDLDEAVRLGLKTPALFLNRANVWHSLGNDANAVADITQTLIGDPDNPIAYNNRGLFWASLGDLQKALDDLNEAVKLDEEYAEAFNNRGVTKAKLGKFQSAYQDYSKAIELDESYGDAYANRGFAAKNLGRFKDALEDYRQAVKLSPKSPQAFNDAAWLIATCPEKRLLDGERAVEYATYACQITDYKNADYIDTLAAAYARVGRYDDAVRTQQQALTMLPEQAHTQALERMKLYKKGKPFVDDAGQSR